MKAIVRTIEGKEGPSLAEVPIPKATPNHLVMKVISSPINPSDYYFCHGFYGKTDYEPYVCGFEAAGIVTEVGEGVPADLIGKKVSVCRMVGTSNDKVGMWSQYARVPYEAVIVLREEDDCDELSGLFINPLTLLGFIRLAKEMGSKAIVHTAALSALGKGLIKVCASEGIDVIGVIRKKEDLETLVKLGAKSALDLNDPDFLKKLRESADKYGAKVAFDAIGGKMTATIIKGMPDGSAVYIYGMLSGEKEDLTSVVEEMKARNIKSQWFVVPNDKIITDLAERKKAVEFLQSDVNSGGKFFKIKVVKKFKLEEYKEALSEYSKVATQGKCIFNPNQ